jgi:ribosomal protein S18 acetylase RimI-like enzyme
VGPHASTTAAIEDNVAGFLMAMGRAGGGEERDEAGITWTVGGSPIGYHNAVVACATASEQRARQLVEDWHGELVRRRLPGSWHLSPSMRPASLADLLAAAGFEDGGDEPAMAADLTADLAVDPPPAPTADRFTAARVTDVDALDAYRDVLACGFGEGPKEADWVASVYRTIGLGDDVPWRHYLGRVDDEPVATTSLFLTPGVAGIYFVCTAPGARRRGIGTAITRHAMLEAQTLGAGTAILGSSPMGHAVYARLGFRDVFSYRLFEWEP